MEFPKSRILAISDIHMDGIIGTPESSCNFSDDDLHTYLTWTLKKYDIVVLNGDIFDTWESSKSELPSDIKEICGENESFSNWAEHKFRERFSTTESLYPRTVTLIKNGGTSYLSGKIVYINGNHDSVCRVFNLIPNAVESYTINCQYPIHFEHGHQADIWNKDNSCLKNVSSICYCCSDILGEVLSIPNLDEDFERLSTLMQGKREEESYVKHAYKLGRRNGYGIVVYGHTHKQILQLLEDGFVYANTGKAGSDPQHNDKIDEIEIEIYNNRVVITQQQRYVRSCHLDVIKRVTRQEQGNSIEEVNTQRNFRIGGESDGQIKRSASI
jgi:predicted phosphodiesterase